MKKLTSFLCVLSLAGTTSLMAQNDAQANLLSNPGFEDTEFQTFSYDNNEELHQLCSRLGCYQ